MGGTEQLMADGTRNVEARRRGGRDQLRGGGDGWFKSGSTRAFRASGAHVTWSDEGGWRGRLVQLLQYLYYTLGEHTSPEASPSSRRSTVPGVTMSGGEKPRMVRSMSSSRRDARADAASDVTEKRTTTSLFAAPASGVACAGRGARCLRETDLY